jgi:hypothetical protein
MDDCFNGCYDDELDDYMPNEIELKEYAMMADYLPIRQHYGMMQCIRVYNNKEFVVPVAACYYPSDFFTGDVKSITIHSIGADSYMNNLPPNLRQLIIVPSIIRLVNLPYYLNQIKYSGVDTISDIKIRNELHTFTSHLFIHKCVNYMKIINYVANSDYTVVFNSIKANKMIKYECKYGSITKLIVSPYSQLACFDYARIQIVIHDNRDRRGRFFKYYNDNWPAYADVYAHFNEVSYVLITTRNRPLKNTVI